MENDDWSSIAPANSPIADNVRRADPSHPLNFFRGRDFAGRYLLSLTGEAKLASLPKPPKLNGIEVHLESGIAGAVRLTLTLEDGAHFEIFKALCDHLLRVTHDQKYVTDANGMKLALRRLREWHDLFRRRQDNLLSPEEVIGLVGELLFLRDFIVPRLTDLEAVLSWRGPHRDEQDFAIGNWLIEIKTQLSTSDQILKISSEAQLDDDSDHLFLCHQCIASAPEGAAGAISLRALVTSLETVFADAGEAALDAFEAGLAGSDYLDRAEYDEAYWLLTYREFYRVTGDFPRITPRNLPTGVQNVSYRIRVANCDSFRVDSAEIRTRVFE